MPATANDDPGATAVRVAVPRFFLRGLGEVAFDEAAYEIKGREQTDRTRAGHKQLHKEAREWEQMEATILKAELELDLSGHADAPVLRRPVTIPEAPMASVNGHGR